jgi:hypothetical protein
MNTERSGKMVVRLEGFWHRAGKVDSLGMPYALPKTDNAEWSGQTLMLFKLTRLESVLDRKGYYTDLKGARKCPLCGGIVGRRIYRYRNVRWTSALVHQIAVHNWRPSSEFTDFLLSNSVVAYPDMVRVGTRVITDMAGKSKGGKDIAKWVKIDENQWAIMDGLMSHGGVRRWLDRHGASRYSEQVGYLEIYGDQLRRTVIGRSDKSVEVDKTILFPQEMDEIVDHQYYFHTHPPTPHPGGRASVGVLYEFPSASDIEHFAARASIGKTQGSIVIAPEGVYIIGVWRVGGKLGKHREEVEIDLPTDFHYQYGTVAMLIQRRAIEKYLVDDNKKKQKNNKKKIDDDMTSSVGRPSAKHFYQVIAQDTASISALNEELHKYNIHVSYFPRVKRGSRWILETVYLPV